MDTTPLSNRIAISIFGKRNAGKSSLINAITGQPVSVTSDVAGTTTDPVHKTMELLPLGPVVFIDTPGLDDEGELGRARVEKAFEVLRHTDMAIIVAASDSGITGFERDFIKEIRGRKIPQILVINKCDISPVSDSETEKLQDDLGLPVIKTCATTGEGIDMLKRLIGKSAKFDDSELSLVGGLVNPGGLAVLVTPIDKAAPKGRLILPQQQVIRDVIESDAIALVTKEQELRETLDSLNKKPDIVITDSQAFLKVSADTPADIPLTSFSILFARQKGDLAEMVRGIGKIASLKDGDRVLIAEGCTHHRQSDDIGKVKIPRWIRQIAGGGIEFEWTSGAAFPHDFSKYTAIVHCGGCMVNRREMSYRMAVAKENGVGITNYGMLIAYVQGILPRALAPFPAAALALKESGIK
ncbi:MAG TPA: [FeFe] hydrogenase H-cluster maturation GTPase HydF [Ruminiclostridium sp.]|nr:[FeFe] hydrogenase H-cluster maturation GTPase HydF [Ruminiclostridium sp.]